MGKLLLFLAAGTIAASSYLYLNAKRMQFDSSSEQSKYEEQVVAREIAQSAHNILSSRVKRDFKYNRETQRDVTYNGGRYTVKAEGPPQGPVTLTTTGKFGVATHTITAILERSGSKLDALTIEGPVDKVDLKDRFVISGLDTKPGSTNPGSGRGLDAHAGRMYLGSAQTDFLDKIVDKGFEGQVIGTGGYADVLTGVGEIDLVEVEEAILTHPARIEFTEDQKFEKSMVFGTPSDPAVVVVFGKLEMKDYAKGYGALYVSGDFKMNDNASWEGVILLHSPGGKIEIMKESAVHGAVIARATDVVTVEGGGDPGLPGGHFDVDVFEGPDQDRKYHQHQYDDKFDRSWVDLKSAGCGSGGMCWDAIIGNDYDQLRVEFMNEAAYDGVYSIKAGASTYAGHAGDGFSEMLDPKTISEFKLSFFTLCGFRGTSPGNVKGDAVNRDGALTVRMYDPGSNKLVYEFSAYEHKKSDHCDVDEFATLEEIASVTAEPIEFKIEDDAGIYYSSEALLRLDKIMPSIVSEDILTTSVRESK